jgi:hypothetical protein
MEKRKRRESDVAEVIKVDRSADLVEVGDNARWLSMAPLGNPLVPLV